MIKLMADSTCDLSNEVLEMYDISLAPLSINIDGKTYKDRVDIEPNEFYGMMEALSDFPTTGMPSPVEYLAIMNEAVESGYKEILCICMSSGTSGSHQSAELAKGYFFEENPDSPVKIHVVDSKCMSHGSGWLVLKSAMMRESGSSFQELVDFNESHKTNVKHFLSVDDLDHLIKSGRLTNASAFLGKLLMLKPIMTMKNGKGAIVAKERGLKRVLKHYVEEFIKRNDEAVTDFIIIGYTSDIKVAENLKIKIENETDFTGTIHIMQMGVSVGTHVGLGALSLFFMEKK
ncbi:DegV family protein [Sutcliffiella horikoshii]|uniref:DegV family protein n=1 Tax=Sutcliffiella horikoshii TaxID=79883 RepID=A0AA94WT75_9BACI|nr:DegV family protein [Sutcliffiella horikoshii]TYS59640.1 DegV family protein [Sutcliffiella horikoshii]